MPDAMSPLVIGGQVILYGYVGDQWDGFTASQVVAALAGFRGQPVTVRVNSVGGDAYEAAAIRSALASHDGAVTVIVEGVALSAASLICCGASRVEIASDAAVMIHDPAVRMSGDAAALAAKAASLDALADMFAAVYAARLGIDATGARALMRAETWWYGAEAVAAGFADAVAAEAAPSAVMAAAEGAPLMIGTAGDPLPDRIRTAALAAGWQEGGPRAAKQEGKTMDPKNPTPAPAPAPAPQMVAPGGGAPAPTPAPAPTMSAAEMVSMVGEAVREARARDREITAQCRALGLSHAAETAMLASDVTMAGIPQAVAAAWMAEGGAPSNGRAPATVRGSRMDAGDTMRAGMVEAMHARMTGAAPEGPGAEWINATVAEMAAACIGHNGPLRTYSERSAVLMSAMHTGSDFAAITGDAINRRLRDVYSAAVPTYRSISEAMTFRDFRAHEVISAGDLPDLLPVGASGDIKSGTFGDGKEVAHLIAYARRFGIARDVWINDDLGALSRVISNYGARVALFEERTFWALALSAKLSDGVAVWHADRGNLGAAALSEDALSAGRLAIRQSPGPDGRPSHARAAFLVVGSDQETAAEKLTSPISAVTSGGVNPFAGRLTPLVSGEIPAGEFLMFADPMQAPAFSHGWLEGAAAPRLRIETPFGSSGVGVSIEHDFGFGPVSAATYRSAA